MLRSTASPPLPPLQSVRLLANMVERFFRDITDKRIRRGVFTSVPELEAAINEYITMHNVKPKPFIWTAKASDILATVTRARAVLNKNTSN